MEASTNLIEPLFEKVEQYTRTNLELVKLKSVDKISSVAASAISGFMISVVLVIFLFLLSIAAAFYIGNILGEIYYGFLAVSAFYGLVALIMLAMRSFIKEGLSNRIIRQFFK
jgi:hypothetical protein